MNTKLFIANKIKVGFNPRPDTYTGMLGYVIGYDGKKWRKEPSWESWRYHFQDGPDYEKMKKAQFDQQLENMKRHSYYSYESIEKFENNYESFQPYGKSSNNKKIIPVEYDNIPTEGFVLNKKAGGYSSGWNHRSTYCRVYDPRGFEFEITIPNLLFILQECNAYKGKGLEGSFVYSWDGKDLVLLPTTCDEFQQSSNFTKLQSGKVGVKDLVEGCTYKTKQLEDYIYLGKFNWFFGDSDVVTIKKNYTFYKVEKPKYGERFLGITSLSSFVQRVTDTPVSNYAELLDEFNKTSYSGVLNNLIVDDYKPVETMKYSRYGHNRNVIDEVALPIGENKFELYSVTGVPDDRSYNSYDRNCRIKHYDLSTNKIVTIKDNNFDIKTIIAKKLETVSKSDLLKMNLKILKTNKNNEEKQIHF